MALWFLNIIAYIINFVVVNWGVELFGGKTIAELSDEYRTQVTPAGWAFSIWGVIYFFELIFVVWGALEGNRSRQVVNQGIGYFFISACLFQAAWEIAFSHEYILASTVLICGIAISLALAVVGLAPFKRDMKVLLCSVPFWTVHFPIGLHGGWTFAASLVNINILVKSDSVSSGTAAVILTAVAASIGASVVAIRFQDQIYLLAIAWAVFAIAARDDYRVKTLGQEEADGITLALNVLCIALLCVGAVTAILDQRQRMTERNNNALDAQNNDGYLLESYYMVQSDDDARPGNMRTARATLLP